MKVELCLFVHLHPTTCLLLKVFPDFLFSCLINFSIFIIYLSILHVIILLMINLEITIYIFDITND